MPSTGQLIRLLAPVPPMLEEALGYYGKAGLVAFYWARCGDELASIDSLGNGYVGANWNAWLVFVRHPAIAPFLSLFDLGSSEDEAKHWLLLDRKQRAFYIGTAEQVNKYLSENALSRQEVSVQIDETDLNTLIEQQLAHLKKALSDWDYNALTERLALEQKAVHELCHWLGVFWQKQSVPKA